jgi:hypothetical protein
MESVLEDFMLDQDGVDPEDGRSFEIATKNYWIRGRVSPFAGSSDVGPTKVVDRLDWQPWNVGAIQVLKYLFGVVRDTSGLLVLELEGPQRADARDILRAADIGVELTRRLLATPGDDGRTDVR